MGQSGFGLTKLHRGHEQGKSGDGQRLQKATASEQGRGEPEPVEGIQNFPKRWIGAGLRLLRFEVLLRPKEPVKFRFSPHFTLLISGSKAWFISKHPGNPCTELLTQRRSEWMPDCS